LLRKTVRYENISKMVHPKSKANCKTDSIFGLVGNGLVSDESVKICQRRDDFQVFHIGATPTVADNVSNVRTVAESRKVSTDDQ
jgi:hypothetical protein